MDVDLSYDFLDDILPKTSEADNLKQSNDEYNPFATDFDDFEESLKRPAAQPAHERGEEGTSDTDHDATANTKEENNPNAVDDDGTVIDHGASFLHRQINNDYDIEPDNADIDQNAEHRSSSGVNRNGTFAESNVESKENNVNDSEDTTTKHDEIINAASTEHNGKDNSYSPETIFEPGVHLSSIKDENEELKVEIENMKRERRRQRNSIIMLKRKRKKKKKDELLVVAGSQRKKPINYLYDNDAYRTRMKRSSPDRKNKNKSRNVKKSSTRTTLNYHGGNYDNHDANVNTDSDGNGINIKSSDYVQAQFSGANCNKSKEYKNLEERMKIYKQANKVLRRQINASLNPQRVTTLEDLVKSKEARLHEVLGENRLLKQEVRRIGRQAEDSIGFQSTFEHKISNLATENRMYKERIKQYLLDKRVEDQHLMKQQAYMIDLEKEVRKLRNRNRKLKFKLKSTYGNRNDNIVSIESGTSCDDNNAYADTNSSSSIISSLSSSPFLDKKQRKEIIRLKTVIAKLQTTLREKDIEIKHMAGNDKNTSNVNTVIVDSYEHNGSVSGEKYESTCNKAKSKTSTPKFTIKPRQPKPSPHLRAMHSSPIANNKDDFRHNQYRNQNRFVNPQSKNVNKNNQMSNKPWGATPSPRLQKLSHTPQKHDSIYYQTPQQRQQASKIPVLASLSSSSPTPVPPSTRRNTEIPVSVKTSQLTNEYNETREEGAKIMEKQEIEAEEERLRLEEEKRKRDEEEKAKKLAEEDEKEQLRLVEEEKAKAGEAKRKAQREVEEERLRLEEEKRKRDEEEKAKKLAEENEKEQLRLVEEEKAKAVEAERKAQREVEEERLRLEEEKRKRDEEEKAKELAELCKGDDLFDLDALLNISAATNNDNTSDDIYVAGDIDIEMELETDLDTNLDADMAEILSGGNAMNKTVIDEVEIADGMLANSSDTVGTGTEATNVADENDLDIDFDMAFDMDIGDLAINTSASNNSTDLKDRSDTPDGVVEDMGHEDFDLDDLGLDF